MTSLSQQLAAGGIVVAPGIYDAFSAHVASTAGFGALYLSGASVAYTRLGRSDIGLVSAAEMVDTIALVRDRVATPMIVDADTGFGNALNTQRTVRTFERAGANALQLEDQTFPKRCGHLAGKTLEPPERMVGKIKAAVDARASEETLIVARTDAIAVEGLAAALDRAALYAEAGADVLFVEAPRNRTEQEAIVRSLGEVRPLLANMVEGGDTPLGSAHDLGELGFRIAIFPGGAVRALGHALDAYYRSLAVHGTNTPFRERMLDFSGLNEMIGTRQLLESGRAYDPES